MPRQPRTRFRECWLYGPNFSSYGVDVHGVILSKAGTHSVLWLLLGQFRPLSPHRTTLLLPKHVSHMASRFSVALK